jgi:hypothetical protein
MAKKRTFTDPATGIVYPLFEAEVDYTCAVYKTDRRKAVIGDPAACIISLGLKHNPDVIVAHIGGGKDAFVTFKGKGRFKAHTKHYVVLAKAAKVRDTFDTKGAPATQHITLSAPTAGRTLDARERMNKRRRAEIKNGSPVKKRATPNRPRITRIGAVNRPTAIISNGAVSMPMLEDA